MSYLILGVVASLAALFLYPIVLDIGKRVAQQFKELENDNDTTN